MVKKTVFLAVLLALTIALSALSCVNAQSIVYGIDHEYAQLVINQDGTIDLTYNITLTCISGVIHGFYVGQPKADFTTGQAVDQYGNALSFSDASSGGEYRADVTLNQPLTAGQSVWFTVTTNVAGMISNDTTNPGNYGMEFAPQWADVPINDVRVQIVLPPGATTSDVKTPTGTDYNGTSTVEGNLAVYWQIQTLQPNQQYTSGCFFSSKIHAKLCSSTANRAWKP